MIARESHAWPVGYGSMLLESFVAIMAMIAACVAAAGRLLRREFAGRHRGRHAGGRRRHHHRLGISRSPSADMQTLAQHVGEQSLFYRTGGAPSLALGMAHIFARERRRPARSSASGITSPSCSRRCSS